MGESQDRTSDRGSHKCSRERFHQRTRRRRGRRIHS